MILIFGLKSYAPSQDCPKKNWTGGLVVQRAAINKYEKGSVTNIPIHTIEKIASVLDVSPTYIVGWNTSMVYKDS